jgi:hypothetical protein
MLNPRTKDAVDILNGLIRVNNERIIFYEHLLENVESLDPDFREFFALLIGESFQNNIWISIEIQTIEGNIEAETNVQPNSPPDGPRMKFYEKPELVKTCEKIEESVRAAYTTAIQSVFIPQYMRVLLKKQIRRLESAKRQLGRF